jgi:hypothetical protein
VSDDEEQQLADMLTEPCARFDLANSVAYKLTSLHNAAVSLCPDLAAAITRAVDVAMHVRATAQCAILNTMEDADRIRDERAALRLGVGTSEPGT